MLRSHGLPPHGVRLSLALLLLLSLGLGARAGDHQLYPKNQSPALDPALFANPTSEYRGAPFWAWNNKLNQEQLLRQIGYLKEMGMGGYHMHCRTGLDTPYMGEEYLKIVKACVEKGKAEGMLSWLYDEDRWPSGFGGGLVTREERFRARHLLFTPRPYATGDGKSENVNESAARARRLGNGKLLGRYAVELDKKSGALASYRRLNEGEQAPAGAKVWYAYLEVATPSAWFNNQTYVDTLNPEAIRKFVEVTHKRYKEALGEDFGTAAPAIFTDEPQFVRKGSLARANAASDIIMPFTDDFPQTYQQAYGEDLMARLPELFWELPGGKVSVARYRYHDHLAERFAAAFADTIGDWCKKNGIALTGHMMEEPTLESQTDALGEAMRSYRSFGITGIDMLCDRHEYTTAKQAQSAAHQYGLPGVLSELYGVTGWHFDFVGHKGQGDWQAALGVTVRVPHLAWVSMAGEAKRDYPASIFYQSPWYKEYPVVENHFARVNTALTRGAPQVRVGVIHPIESYWLSFGPRDKTGAERNRQEKAFEETINWLLFGTVDFDYIAESLLPSQDPKQEGKRFTVGKMAYDVVIAPPMRTIRATTLERLEAFAKAGGQVIFAGQVPALVDAVPSDRAAKLAARCKTVAFEQEPLLAALAEVRDLEVKLADGKRADSLIYQMRADGENRQLFICNTDRTAPREGAQVRLRGDWRVTLLDTMSGKMQALPATREGGWTSFAYDFAATGHLLATLSPAKGEAPAAAPAPAKKQWAEAPLPAGAMPVTLSEPNVLVLDQAQWRVGGGEWEPAEELLRLDNLARARMGMKARTGQIAQPWTEQDDPAVLGQLELKFAIDSAVAVAKPTLAVEQPGEMKITLDGKPVSSQDNGWWVDESIRTVALPELGAGKHELVMNIAYRKKTNVEWAYILGDFGVKVNGREAQLIAPVRELTFGDWTSQGLPFYAGNVTYHCRVTGGAGEMAIRTARFKAPVLSVAVDGQRVGPIAFAPFELELGKLGNGEHKLDVTVFGNRANAFGCLHRVANDGWIGPQAWRTTGAEWTYPYHLQPMGLLEAPLMLTQKAGK